MFSVGVVVGLDVGEEFDFGVGVIVESAALEHFGFESADLRFGPGIVVRVGSGGHALAHAGFLQELAVGGAAVLTAPVAVEDEVGEGAT